jgi:hypothetical protein
MKSVLFVIAPEIRAGDTVQAHAPECRGGRTLLTREIRVCSHAALGAGLFRPVAQFDFGSGLI